MRLYPETKFIVEVEDELDFTFPYFIEKMVGKHSFQIESIFGKKEVNYNGSSDVNQIYFTRSIDSWNTIPVYPSSNIKFVLELNKTKLNVRCSISTSWIVFFT
jgi:hypothetical protein